MTISNLSFSNLPVNILFSFVVITKLDGNNYLVWRLQVLPSICNNGLEDFVNREKSTPNRCILRRSDDKLIENLFFQCLEKTRSASLRMAVSKSLIPCFCSACQYGKIHKLYFSITNIKTSAPLELIHTDLWGTSSTISVIDFRYYISLLDDFSRYTWIFPLKVKSEALAAFAQFKI